MIQKKFVEKIKTNILRSIFFFSENPAVYEIISKILYNRTGHRWQYNTLHAQCMLDT